jgi:DNA-binding IclR family transcriptional regulator
MRADAPRIRPVPAVTRAIAILRLVSRSPTALTVKSIADALNLVPSTVLHTARALVSEGLLKVDPKTKQYSLGVGVLPFARALLEHSDFPNLVRPKLEVLSRRYNVTATAAEAANLRNMVIVAIANALDGLRVHVDVGTRLPGLVTATGRCLAAFGGFPASAIEAEFKRLRWPNGPSYETWLKQVEETRRQGFSIDREYIDGLTIVAVPVLNANGVLAFTLGAVGFTSLLEPDQPLALAQDMRATASEVARELFSST